MFVCLICGRDNIAPQKKCPGPLKPNPNWKFPDSLGENPTCHQIEERVNEERARHFNGAKQLYLAEARLKIRLCDVCLGFGCNVCGGRGGR